MFPFTRTVLIFFIVGLLFLCASSASNLGSVPHPAETGLLIPSGKRSNRTSGVLARDLSGNATSRKLVRTANNAACCNPTNAEALPWIPMPRLAQSKGWQRESTGKQKICLIVGDTFKAQLSSHGPCFSLRVPSGLYGNPITNLGTSQLSSSW